MAATLLSSIISQIRVHLKEETSLVTPGAPTITPQGTGGAATWSYKIEALNRNQTSIASATGSTAVGNATLSATNNNQITWAAITGATAYRVWRTAVGSSPTTTGMIGIVGSSALQFNDTGLTGDLATPPTGATGGAFWTDQELLNIVINGAKDLWAALLDTFGEHFFTVDTTNVTLQAGLTQLSGVPTDVFRVNLIEPADTTVQSPTRNMMFQPRKYNHPDFVIARSIEPLDPLTAGTVIFYDVSGAGSPNGAPTILVAPPVATTMALRFVYNPTLPALTLSSANPIPSESDQALIAYGVAFARAKERDDHSPDPNWIAVYSTEKQSILTRSTPRQDQEPDMVVGMFDDMYY